MRLIDADAEITKIEQEIEKYETGIIWLQNKKSEEPENNYIDWDETIERCERNILDCKKEIRMLQSYSTAYDPDKVVEQINEIGKSYCNSVKCDKNCLDCDHGCIMNAITKAVKEGGVE